MLVAVVAVDSYHWLRDKIRSSEGDWRHPTQGSLNQFQCGGRRSLVRGICPPVPPVKYHPGAGAAATSYDIDLVHSSDVRAGCQCVSVREARFVSTAQVANERLTVARWTNATDSSPQAPTYVVIRRANSFLIRAICLLIDKSMAPRVRGNRCQHLATVTARPSFIRAGLTRCVGDGVGDGGRGDRRQRLADKLVCENVAVAASIRQNQWIDEFLLTSNVAN